MQSTSYCSRIRATVVNLFISRSNSTPHNVRFVLEAYVDITRTWYDYNLLDLRSEQDDDLHLRTNIFPAHGRSSIFQSECVCMENRHCNHAVISESRAHTIIANISHLLHTHASIVVSIVSAKSSPKAVVSSSSSSSPSSDNDLATFGSGGT